MPSSPPIVSLSSVSGIECYALIDTCGGGVPCLDEITRMFRGPFSDDGRSVPIALSPVSNVYVCMTSALPPVFTLIGVLPSYLYNPPPPIFHVSIVLISPQP